MQRKKNTKSIKVRDLKPKKDAKGGVVANVNTGTSMGRGVNRPSRGDSPGGHSVNLHI
jgi:hypothetical protein